VNCPKCNEPCDRDSVDVGVGVIHGPYGCANCGWSEDSDYDLSEGRDPVDEKGGAIDQWGGYHPPGSSMALAYRLARAAEDETSRGAFLDEASAPKRGKRKETL
jgi:hypothetical protein